MIEIETQSKRKESYITMNTVVVNMTEKGEFTPLKSQNPQENRDLIKLNIQGLRNLVASPEGLIAKAVEDIRSLIRAGVVVKGKIITDSMPRKVNDGMTIPEAKRLLDFFKDDNSEDTNRIGFWLNIAGIEVDPSTFRKRLGFSW